MDVEEIGTIIVDSAIRVHRTVGPGLLESTYQKCLAHELTKRGLKVDCELLLPIEYDGVRIESGYRVDMLVDDCVIIENKTVDNILPIHEAQLLTYMRLTGCKVGLLVNFNGPVLKHGIKRMVL
ncbi:MAG: GxxExxY protein [Anaerolineales bacterium]|nr:GxxExxY protein [Anaerolineales bacterium]